VKPKHIEIRIEQCLALAKASNCPRRKFGALLLDPERNVILMDGYNGGPRGGGNLCGGEWCFRDGVSTHQLRIVAKTEREHPNTGTYYVNLEPGGMAPPVRLAEITGQTAALDLAAELPKRFPPIRSGTEIQIGCHHAEMNIVCNAAASGVATRGAWLIITGEPCMMCAKLLHHAGIAKVLVVKGGYMGSNGIAYLQEHGVEIEYVDGPRDPRSVHHVDVGDADPGDAYKVRMERKLAAKRAADE